MKKLMNGGLAALVAVATVVTAIPVSAQPGRDRDRGEQHRDRGNDGRGDRGDRHDNRREWNRGSRYHADNGWHRGRDEHSERRWRYYGGSYGYDGYGGRWRSGQRYPYWRDRSYYISDYGMYGLPAPRRGYRYYRTDNGDIVMVAIASGIIGLIVGGALADHRGR